MVRLEYAQATGREERHRTWTRIEGEPYQLSPLQNQFALAEYALPDDEAVQQFRGWLWREVQDPFPVVGKAMRQLAMAHRQGREVEIVVPQDAPHGDVLVRALLWLAQQVPAVEPPALRGSEPGPCYEPILTDGIITTRAEIDPKHIVWITGRTQSRIGVICGWGQAFVPEYGVIPLKNFRWVKQSLATSPGLQCLLNDALDQAFAAEADATPLDYDPAPPYDAGTRFADEEWFWQPTAEEIITSEAALAAAERDALTVAEQLVGEGEDVETALMVAQLPDVEDWYVNRPPLSSYNQAETMRPVYQYRGENAPLMVKSVAEQVEGKRFRYATKAETEDYRRTFRQKP